MTYQEKIVISQQLCQAIVFMHSSEPPVAHMDVKPENVLVSDGIPMRVLLRTSAENVGMFHH